MEGDTERQAPRLPGLFCQAMNCKEGSHSKLEAGSSSQWSSSGVSGVLGAPGLNVRPFEVRDTGAVRRIFRRHFRSLCTAAVEYYCIQHFRDLAALLVIGKLFLTWKDLGLSSVLFLIYLFVRARLEMELYIYRHCPDLDDIMAYYMQASPRLRSHFWVAEMTAGPLAGRVVGCVGCRAARDDPTVAQLLRLAVSPDARRMRHGSRLLAQFETFAVEKGFREVRLLTNNLSTSHMKFIRQHGYELVQIVPRNLMRGSLIQWKKSLRSPQAAVGTQVPSPLGLGTSSDANWDVSRRPATTSGLIGDAPMITSNDDVVAAFDDHDISRRPLSAGSAATTNEPPDDLDDDHRSNKTTSGGGSGGTLDNDTEHEGGTNQPASITTSIGGKHNNLIAASTSD